MIMDIKKNDDIELHIDNMTSEGAAVGHYGGVAVFVRGAVTGDDIIAHIIKTSKRYCIGIVKEIVNHSPHRIKSDCTASAKCGGCSFRNMTYAEELRFKRSRVEDAIKRIGHIDVPVNDVIGAEKIDGYRNKAQYPVSINDGELIAGFYAYKSHRIIPCASCRLQPAEFEKCLAAFAEWVEKSGVTSYDESSGRGLLRHIYLRKTSTGEIMACAVTNGEKLPQADLLIRNLTQIDGVKSICRNVNTKNSNVILGGTTKVLWGSESVTDVLLGKKFEISPNSFYQVNHDQCEKLYLKAAEYADLTGDEVLCDIYCGAGTIGLTMADRAKQIYGIEIIPQAVENARKNAKLNGIENAGYICGDAQYGAAELEKRGIRPDVAVLDPPRKGCSAELLGTVCRMSPKRIVYVSCDPATLARDLQILSSSGYTALEATPVDMFPRTPHIETVVVLHSRTK